MTGAVVELDLPGILGVVRDVSAALAVVLVVDLAQIRLSRPVAAVQILRGLVVQGGVGPLRGLAVLVGVVPGRVRIRVGVEAVTEQATATQALPVSAF
jgi:hypothetical protein